MNLTKFHSPSLDSLKGGLGKFMFTQKKNKFLPKPPNPNGLTVMVGLGDLLR